MPIQRPNGNPRKAVEIIAENIGTAKRDAKDAQKKVEELNTRLMKAEQIIDTLSKNNEVVVHYYSDLLDKIMIRTNLALGAAGVALAGLIILSLKLQGLL